MTGYVVVLASFITLALSFIFLAVALAVIRKPESIMAGRDPGNIALIDRAMLVKRAGLEHLVVDPTAVEVLALAKAGEVVAYERIDLLAKAFRDPLEFKAIMDGGAAKMDCLLDAELAKIVGRLNGSHI